jgi:hypothetical protein
LAGVPPKLFIIGAVIEHLVGASSFPAKEDCLWTILMAGGVASLPAQLVWQHCCSVIMYVPIRAYCFNNIQIFDLKNVGTGGTAAFLFPSKASCVGTDGVVSWIFSISTFFITSPRRSRPYGCQNHHRAHQFSGLSLFPDIRQRSQLPI